MTSPATSRTALVTGASTGIGRASALALHAAGLTVIAAMRTPDRTGLPDGVRVVELDVDDDASVAAAFEAAGPVDVLVNNAGTSPTGATEDFPIEAWHALFETNLFGAVRCTRAVLPHVRAVGGVIVNVSSFVARVAHPAMGAYGASKAALEAWSEALGAELVAFGGRVVVIEPGAIRTPIQQKTQPPPRESVYRDANRNWGLASRSIHARASDPEVVAAAVVQAATDPSCPFRVPVGHGAAELLAWREKLSDEAWIATWGQPTDGFVAAYREEFGVDLRER